LQAPEKGVVFVSWFFIVPTDCYEPGLHSVFAHSLHQIATLLAPCLHRVLFLS
jgi:hypothetical protein